MDLLLGGSGLLGGL